MKERGNSVISEHENTNFLSDSNYFSSSSDVPCKKHPFNPSSVGICAYCLHDRLTKLVCSDCGEQRLSSCSCSCSEISSYRNSACTGDEQRTLFSHMKLIEKSEAESEGVVLLKRSDSCVVEVKKSNGLWRIGKLFKKKREKIKIAGSERNRGGFDQKSEVCVMDVSRSRSLSSFMDGDFELEVGSMGCSTAKVSNFNESEPKKSGITGGLMDSKSGFLEKETDFSRIDDDDDDEFIDLKIDLSDNSTTEQYVSKKLKNSHMKPWKERSSFC